MLINYQILNTRFAWKNQNKKQTYKTSLINIKKNKMIKVDHIQEIKTKVY